MMLDVCDAAAGTERPKVTLPSSVREAVKQLWIRHMKWDFCTSEQAFLWKMSVSADIIHLSNKMDLNDAVIFVYPFIWQVDDIKKKGVNVLKSYF